MFSRIYKSSYVVFYTYEDILLSLYIGIARTGDFEKIVRSGKASIDKCIEAYEELVKRQQKESGNNQYDALLRLNKGYLITLNDYTTIRACLILVSINYLYVDWEYIKFLKSKGINIDLSTPERILETVKHALHKNEVLITKAVTKRKELEKIVSQSESNNEGPGFEQLIANLNYGLGFNVNEDITLVRYNEYQKILKAKTKATDQAHGRNK